MVPCHICPALQWLQWSLQQQGELCDVLHTLYGSDLACFTRFIACELAAGSFIAVKSWCIDDALALVIGHEACGTQTWQPHLFVPGISLVMYWQISRVFTCRSSSLSV